MRLTLTFLLVVVLSCSALAGYKDLTEAGNTAYQEDSFEEALKLYKEAEVERPQEPFLDYNIASTLHQQAKYAEAVERYSKALYADDPALQADAYYNIGNSLFRSDMFAEAIQAYQKALELMPDDLDAKYNLELARKKLKEQAQQQQSEDQQQDQQQDQEQQENQDQQEQQQQDQQQQDQQNQDQQQQQQDQQEQDQQEQNQQQQEEQQGSGGEEGEASEQQTQAEAEAQDQSEMKKEDALRILNAISGDEKDLQKKIRRLKVRSNYKGKDW